ncbi:MAG TPA: hypothetical protein VND64_02445 [Pirellulales bacterium]|nr:hypothetical protein [Pirellulales bacterium]
MRVGRLIRRAMGPFERPGTHAYRRLFVDLDASAYWYIRNLVLTGTPFFPMGLSPGTHALAQVRADIWSSTLLGCGSAELPWLLGCSVRRSLGPLHLAACLALPFGAARLLLDGARGWRDGAAQSVAGARALLVPLTIGAAAVLGATPFCAEIIPGTLDSLRGGYLPPRFGLCPFTLAVLVVLASLDGCLGWSIFRWPVRQLDFSFAHAALAVVALAQLAPPRGQSYPASLLEGALCSLPIMFAVVIQWQVRDCWPRLRAPFVVGVLSTAVVSLACGALGASWHARFATNYDRMFSTRFFSKMAEHGREDVRICTLAHRYYPFLGSRRQFAAARPTWLANYASLLEYVGAQGATRLVTNMHDMIPGNPAREVERLVRADRLRFIPVGADNGILSYRVDQEKLEATREMPIAPATEAGQ